MKKRWIGWIVLSLLVLLLPVLVLAEGGTCGENLTWNLENGVLTISGTGKMDDYDRENSRSPWYGKKITSAVLEEGITNIGNYAFFDCTSLTSITLPDSVTEISDTAFDKCPNLILKVYPDSYAEQYAKEKNLSYFYSESDTSWLFD